MSKRSRVLFVSLTDARDDLRVGLLKLPVLSLSPFRSLSLILKAPTMGEQQPPIALVSPRMISMQKISDERPSIYLPQV